MEPPHPYFGSKRLVAAEMWRRLGDVDNLVIPFYGSGSELLARPQPFHGVETVNDADGLLSNFVRSVQLDPDAVVRYADCQISEVDLHARHAWLVQRRETITRQLEGDPDWCDPKAAGYWLYGICLWVGSDWCSGRGPWRSVEMLDGTRQLIDWSDGPGIKRKRPHLADAGRGIFRPGLDVRRYMLAVSERLRRVRICCGDWSRVIGPAATIDLGMTAVILDPPYAEGREAGLYSIDSLTVAADVRSWAIKWGDHSKMRIVICGLENLDMPSGWSMHRWRPNGGLANCGDGRGRENSRNERLWFSRHCLGQDLFAGIDDVQSVA